VADEEAPKEEQDGHPSSLKVSVCRQCPEEDNGCCDDGNSEHDLEDSPDRLPQFCSSGFRGDFGGGGSVGGGAVDCVSHCFEFSDDGVVWTTYQLGLFWLRGLACFFGAFGHDDVGLRFFGRCGLVRVSCKITLQTVFGTYIVTALFRLLFVFVQRDHNSPIKQVF
jgi:hypothetical protein